MADRPLSRAGRAPWLRPVDLDESQRHLYDAITAGPRGSDSTVELTDADGRLIGPFNAMLFSPAIGAKLQALGADIRYSARLAARSREIAILEVARARRSEFEWHAHARIGRAAGLTEDEIDAIRTGAVVALPPSEAIVRDVAKMLVTTRDLDDDLFGRAEPVLGVAALSEIITLVGYYDLLALSLRVWRTPLPPGAEPVFGEQ